MPKTLRPIFALMLLVFFASAAVALPRDGAAVLNRCGKPLKGELTIYENTVAGGRRMLEYERGTLTFNRVGNDGWTFDHGQHRKLDNLTAEQMEKYMPCIKDALADSAIPEPLKPQTAVTRVETSVKRDYKRLILYTLIGLVVIGIGFFLWSRRKPADEEDDE